MPIKETYINHLRSRPQIHIARELHRRLKDAATAESIPIGAMADRFIRIGLEQWEKEQAETDTQSVA